MGAEQTMIDEIDKNFNAINLINKTVSANKSPDASFKGTINGNDYFFVLEAKVYNEYNLSNYPKQLLSEILINRHGYSLGYYKNGTKAPITYGLLLSYDNKKTDGIYTFLSNHILNDDWISFGKLYNCKYVFLYDITGKQLYYQDWDTFLSNLNPLPY